MNIATLWFAADVVIKATAILLAAWALCAIMPSAPASRRHLIWFVSLASVLVMPVLCLVLPEWRILPNWAGTPSQSFVRSAANVGRADVPIEFSTRPVNSEPAKSLEVSRFTGSAQMIVAPTPSSIAPARSNPSSKHLAPICNLSSAPIAIWVIGLAVFLLRIALARISLCRLAARSTVANEGEVAELFAEASHELQVRRHARLLMSDDRSMPMTWSSLRPRILLPADARNWSHDRLRMALLHELAHVKRWDAATQFIGQFACAVFWFHPLAWLASRGLLREQEQAADDLVLSRQDSPADYASFLLDVARMIGSRKSLIPGSIAMARQATLESRLKAVLDGRRSREAMSVWRAIFAALAALPILFSIASLRATAAAPSGTTAGQTQTANISKVFSGRVVSPDGKPVNNAQIVLANSHHETVAQGRSRADGSFEIAGDTAETEESRPTLVAKTVGVGYGAIWAKSGKENVIHILPASSVRVTLVAPDGAPAAGVRVWPVYSSIGASGMVLRADFPEARSIEFPVEWSSEDTQQTDASGSCEISLLPQQSQTSLHIDGPDFAQPLMSERVQTGAGKQSLPATLHLKYGGAIEGTVLYKGTGKPAAGVRVIALADRRIGFSGQQTTTDEHGHYHFQHLLPGKFVIHLIANKDFPWTAAFLSNVVVNPRQSTVGQDLLLVKGTVVTGRLIKGDTGAGVPGMIISALDLSTKEYPGSTETDENGNYTLRIPPGAQAIYLASMPPDGYSQAGFSSRRGDELKITAVDGQDQKIDLKLTPEPGNRLAGRVLDPQGKPVAGAIVEVQNPAGPMMRTTKVVKSDAKGEFTLHAVDRGFRVYAHAGSLGTPQPIELKGDEKELILRLSPIAKTQLAGRVVDGKGKPLANVGIYVTTWHGTFGLTPKAPIVLTDADGRFTLPGPSINTRYLLKARASDGRESAQRTIEYTPNTPNYELGDLHLEN